MNPTKPSSFIPVSQRITAWSQPVDHETVESTDEKCNQIGKQIVDQAEENSSSHDVSDQSLSSLSNSREESSEETSSSSPPSETAKIPLNKEKIPHRKRSGSLSRKFSKRVKKIAHRVMGSGDNHLKPSIKISEPQNRRGLKVGGKNIANNHDEAKRLFLVLIKNSTTYAEQIITITSQLDNTTLEKVGLFDRETSINKLGELIAACGTVMKLSTEEKKLPEYENWNQWKEWVDSVAKKLIAFQWDIEFFFELYPKEIEKLKNFTKKQLKRLNRKDSMRKSDNQALEMRRKLTHFISTIEEAKSFPFHALQNLKLIFKELENERDANQIFSIIENALKLINNDDKKQIVQAARSSQQFFTSLLHANLHPEMRHNLLPLMDKLTGLMKEISGVLRSS